MLRKFPKLTAMLTVAVMMASTVLSGCGSEKALESTTSAQSTTAAASTAATQPTLAPAKIKWVLRIPTQKDGEAVLAEVNKTFKEKINATLEIQFIEAPAYAEKTKLMIAAAEEFDIMFTSIGYGFYENVAKGAFQSIDGIVKQYAPNAYGQIPEKFWDATKVNGKIFGFPNYQIAARQTALVMRKDIADKYGVNMGEIKTYEQLEPALEKIKAGEPADKFVFNCIEISGIDMMTYLGLEVLGPDKTPGAVEIDGTDYKVFNQYEHSGLVSLAKLTRSWQEKGYINQDLSLVKEGSAVEELYKTGKIITASNAYKPGAEAEWLARYGFEPSYAILTEPFVTTASVAATLQAISATSKNPERAMMLLEIVNTDKLVYNTLLYGLENKHYKKTGENSVEVIKDSGYSTNVGWMLGKQLNAYLLPGVASDIPELVDQMNKSSKTSRLLGFSFDVEPVKTEIAQCLSIVDKYLPGFKYGMFDVDSTLAKMNTELKAAGMDKVIAEKQSQLDAWVAANK